MKIISDANIQPGTRVFIRVDLDVPITNGQIGETYRLNAALPSLKYIIGKKGIPVIAGHMGKPDGVFKQELSTKLLKPYFDRELGVNNYELLENLRFDLGEEQNSEDYAKSISNSCQLYVNESFATSHRKHASIVGIPQFLPSYAGLRLQQEVQNLDKIMQNPPKPFVVIIGGAKLESKKPTVAKFLGLADQVLIGGKIGLEWNEEVPSNLYLPKDYLFDNLDIGDNTTAEYQQIIIKAKTILWAGPMGKFEDDAFFIGTKKIAIAIATATKMGAFSIVGGGDTVSAADKAGLLHEFSFVSTGGGAMLEYLANGTLPGIEALK